MIVTRAVAAHRLRVMQTFQSAGSWVARPAGQCAAPPIWKSALRRAWQRSLTDGATHRLTKCVVVANVAWWLAGSSLHAAILTSVPMQGGMVMPMLRYTASTGTLTVTMDPTVPQLTPLLVSNLGDYFDPADPWYEYLDPTRQGLAFSRRYGFVMDTASDPLPAGRAIWIRKLSSSANLGAYRYRSGANKAWDPIFGTAGTTNALQWDGTMFHPGFTAPPGTQTYTATFEAFVMDTTTGTPVPGGSTGPFVFNWTDVPDGRPTLCVGPNVVITWPALTATNYILEAADTMSGSVWTSVTNEPIVQNNQWVIVLEPSKAHKFFRMRLGP